jgi:pimeloyl-ACP methyl ester carboxylesterase
MSEISTVNTPDGLSWLVRQVGLPNRPHLILIPSGEGDSFIFTNLMTHVSTSFKTTTFDMPGFSHTIGSNALTDLSLRTIATQIVGLMDVLHIPSAAFWGSSTGGLSALALLKYYPDRVENIIVHEVTFEHPPYVLALREQDDEGIVKVMKPLFRDVLAGDNSEAWDALGEEYHLRLGKDCVNNARTNKLMHRYRKQLCNIHAKLRWCY